MTDKDSQMSEMRMTGTKGKQPEELKGIDARDLIARFRSKSDLYDYLSQHRKCPPSSSKSSTGQFYMPPRKKVTKDFLKEVFAGRKHLIPRAQLRPVEVPKYDELSVVSLIADIMKEKELAKFLPEQRTRADLPDRQFFFNVVITTDPDYLAALLKHAHNLRFGAKNPQDNPTTIEVNEQWAKELQASPFYFRKDFPGHLV